jgi:hypothetical protein
MCPSLIHTLHKLNISTQLLLMSMMSEGDRLLLQYFHPLTECIPFFHICKSTSCRSPLSPAPFIFPNLGSFIPVGLCRFVNVAPLPFMCCFIRVSTLLLCPTYIKPPCSCRTYTEVLFLPFMLAMTLLVFVALLVFMALLGITVVALLVLGLDNNNGILRSIASIILAPGILAYFAGMLCFTWKQ